jgi:hypothetical protein
MDRKQTGLNQINHRANDLQLQDVSGTDHILLPPLSIITIDPALDTLPGMDVLVSSTEFEVPCEKSLGHLTVIE